MTICSASSTTNWEVPKQVSRGEKRKDLGRDGKCMTLFIVLDEQILRIDDKVGDYLGTYVCIGDLGNKLKAKLTKSTAHIFILFYVEQLA